MRTIRHSAPTLLRRSSPQQRARPRAVAASASPSALTVAPSSAVSRPVGSCWTGFAAEAEERNGCWRVRAPQRRCALAGGLQGTPLATERRIFRAPDPRERFLFFGACRGAAQRARRPGRKTGAVNALAKAVGWGCVRMLIGLLAAGILLLYAVASG